MIYYYASREADYKSSLLSFGVKVKPAQVSPHPGPPQLQLNSGLVFLPSYAILRLVWEQVSSPQRALGPE